MGQNMLQRRSLNLLRSEIKKLRRFYRGTIDTYAFNELNEYLKEDETIDNNIGNFFTNNEILRKKTLKNKRNLKNADSTLRELILVRIISALEAFLVDLVRDAFVVTKQPFLDKNVTYEFTQEDLLYNNNPTEIYKRIIQRETRRLTNGSFTEVIKYYKKRFDLDLASIAPGYNVMNEYHDRRHILVHRLGVTDEQYRKKYKSTESKLSVTEPYLKELFNNIENFSSDVFKGVKNSLLPLIEKSEKYKNAKLIFDVLFITEDSPNFLDMGYQFWAKDEYIVLADLILGTSPMDEGTRYYFTGSTNALMAYKRTLKRARKNYEIIYKIVLDQTHGQKSIPLSEEIISKVSLLLPEQPWPSGIHKKIASELGMTNSASSRAIKELIFRGVFSPQLDGKVMS